MKKRKILSLLLVLMLCISLFACGDTKEEDVAYAVPEELQAMYDEFIEAVDPDTAYSIALELTENPEFWNSSQGGRNAGSEAEHKAAEWIKGQMEDIGLKNVELAAADCDKHQFNGASLTIEGQEKLIEPYSYATAATPAEGITAEIVYVGDGTMWDYENVDVEGKIVLVDIDQRANWWITYPMLEAEYQGAAAIMSANVGGFSQINKDARNANDICGPTGIPCVSISLNESEYIQGLLEEGTVTANLKVDNEVSEGGTTYNVMGVIPGKNSENKVIIGAHYDMHFYGFQDDNCAVGMSLAMAKAMIDSGYVPENDIIFCMHGAEEWGSSYTEFDWTVGAWEMINNIHPEWQGKILAFINSELPAYEFGDYTSTYSAPEMFSMIDFFANTYPLSPEPEGCFKEGILTEGYQTYTYSDDFSYYAAGVPSTVNGFLLQKDMETVFPFYEEIYHTDYDTAKTYNEAVMDFNIKYYGAMAMYIDQMPALYLDFTSQYDRLSASLNDEILEAAGVDVVKYKEELDALNQAADALKTRTVEVNDSYIQAWIDGDEDAMAELKAEGKDITKKNLDAFKYAQSTLLGLMYERPIVPHEAPQENIDLMQQTIGFLEEGDVVSAADETAWLINNVLEWYNMYFSPEVIAVQDDMLWGENNQDNLYWGTGINFTKAPVEAATRGIMLKYEEENPDLSEEIQIYQDAIKQQTDIMISLVDEELEAIKELTAMLTVE